MPRFPPLFPVPARRVFDRLGRDDETGVLCFDNRPPAGTSTLVPTEQLLIHDFVQRLFHPREQSGQCFRHEEDINSSAHNVEIRGNAGWTYCYAHRSLPMGQ